MPPFKTQMKKTGYLGNEKITYIEDDEEGDWAFIDGEWVYLRRQKCSHSSGQ